MLSARHARRRVRAIMLGAQRTPSTHAAHRGRAVITRAHAAGRPLHVACPSCIRRHSPCRMLVHAHISWRGASDCGTCLLRTGTFCCRSVVSWVSGASRASSVSHIARPAGMNCRDSCFRRLRSHGSGGLSSLSVGLEHRASAWCSSASLFGLRTAARHSCRCRRRWAPCSSSSYPPNFFPPLLPS